MERFHRTLDEALAHRGYPTTMEGFQVALPAIRQDYNHDRPISKVWPCTCRRRGIIPALDPTAQTSSLGCIQAVAISLNSTQPATCATKAASTSCARPSSARPSGLAASRTNSWSPIAPCTSVRSTCSPIVPAH
ncbi:MAG: hypothetical protein IPG72_09585 [Ardenticatenales bacterium]|nr:hypothetical protein [Ardenticatenales bacterium]